MRVFLLLISLLLYGCMQDRIHTVIYSDMCIKPYKGYHYLTCCDIHFSIEGNDFTIPKGFETDLASIPRGVWSVMSPAHSSLIRPAIVHDWFYRKTCDFDRKQTDLIFYHMLKNDGISVLRASIMYYSVRLWGWRYYNEDYCDD